MVWVTEKDVGYLDSIFSHIQVKQIIFNPIFISLLNAWKLRLVP